jgi:hypothetical protein
MQDMQGDLKTNPRPEDIVQKTFTNSEILCKLISKDDARLYTSVIAYQNLKLMLPKDVAELFENEKLNNDKKIKEIIKDKDTCETIIISKIYTSLEQLQYDDDAVIYFDKKYDKTNYGLMEDTNVYAKEVINLTTELLKEHIIKDQMKKNKLTEKEADYLSDTLIDGNKKVIDGQYAILFKGYAENIKDQSDYYVRKNNKWVLDKNMSADKEPLTDEGSILCDLQEKCMNVSTKTDDKCESMSKNELNLQNSLLTNIISEFDTKYKLSKEQFEKEIKENYNYFMDIMPIVSKIEMNFLLKYNNFKYKLGTTAVDDEKGRIVSPFAEILDIILGQPDFVKKQGDIVKFCVNFTRPFIDGFSISDTLENEHWLYCVNTGVPLLPAFKCKLAAAYMISPDRYMYELRDVKRIIGQNSEDTNCWTDKFTGWTICQGDFDTEEGYNDGFKVHTRDVLEEPAGDEILEYTKEPINPIKEKTVKKYITPEAISVNNIVNALSISMGINIEHQKEFIINSVIEIIRLTVESQNDYKERIKIAASQKGKEIPSYSVYFNTTLLYSTLGLYLIALQTSIPSIKTKKTHPGCVRSFTGYPFDGQGDLSSVKYLACITFSIRDSGEPWNVLKKTNADKIQRTIQAFMDANIITLPEVQRKFDEKTEYLLTNPSNDVPIEHDIRNWSDFLPPLVPFKIKHLTNVSSEFIKGLSSDFIRGSREQREKILVIESKIIMFSLFIQEKINDIVKKEDVILNTANNDPYLENACCDTNDRIPTIEYFTGKNKDISEFNQIVKKLGNILDDIKSNTEAFTFYSNIITKYIYPPVLNLFDEKTIYITFIFYCKFKSLMPVPANLLLICEDKPDSTLIGPSDSIDRIIEKLKGNGRNYTTESFLRLLQLIGRENIINIKMDDPLMSGVTKFSNLLENITDEPIEDEIIEPSLVKLISNSIDTFDVATESYSKQLTDLNNFLIKHTEEMTTDLIDFIESNKANITRKSIKSFNDTITNLSDWNICKSTRKEDINISNSSVYCVNNFYKTFIDNFVNVFPNIILNEVNYEYSFIQKYFKFSPNHESKLRGDIYSYFKNLKPFYGIPTVLNILKTIQTLGKNMVNLANTTPCFSNIKIDEKILMGMIDEETSRRLFEYYLIRILIAYVDLTDNDSMIVIEVNTTEEISDILSVDYINSAETIMETSISSSQKQKNKMIIGGNKMELKRKTAEMLIAFMDIFQNEKEIIDVTYEEIQDRIFKMRETEKHMHTDKLKNMTDELRDTDTMLKGIGLGMYSKGKSKGLKNYDATYYDEEQELSDRINVAENTVRNKNKRKANDYGASDGTIEDLGDDFLAQQNIANTINGEVFDLNNVGENFYDGDDGYGDEDTGFDN